MSPNPITYQELLAYCTLTETTLNTEEIKIIKLLDCWELNNYAKEQKKKSKK